MPKGFVQMVQMHYWFNRALLLGALVATSAAAAGSKWNTH
jgi:hypothetical protein